MNELFLGNYERMIGKGCCIMVRGKYIRGTVISYLFKSGKFEVKCEDGKFRKTDKLYL